MPFAVGDRRQRHGRRRRGIGPRILLNDARQLLPRLVVISALDVLSRSPHHRAGLKIVRNGEYQPRHNRAEERGDDGGEDEETARAHGWGCSRAAPATPSSRTY